MKLADWLERHPMPGGRTASYHIPGGWNRMVQVTSGWQGAHRPRA
jgi:hypothetical protein